MIKEKVQLQCPTYQDFETSTKIRIIPPFVKQN